MIHHSICFALGLWSLALALIWAAGSVVHNGLRRECECTREPWKTPKVLDIQFAVFIALSVLAIILFAICGMTYDPAPLR